MIRERDYGTVTCKLFSEVLGLYMNMDIILPQRTSGQTGMKGARKDGKYPVLYLLHGMSDDHTIWQRRTSIEMAAIAR